MKIWKIKGVMFALFLLISSNSVDAINSFDVWHVGGDWYSAENARLDTWNEKRLIGDRGEGVLVNGRIGKTQSLITKRRDFRDVEVHLEFMLARHANSGIIFHGNYEIQLLDSAHVQEPTGAHCGGIYPRAEEKPTYHHIDKGSPPRVNAAKPPGEWQTMDIIFQSPRFDKAGKKTAHARFVKVVHNGRLIQESVDVPYASGPNWNRKQHPQGPIIIQGDYGPIAIRNVRVRDWKGADASDKKKLNTAPKGFTALFNGKDLTGWHTPPLVKEFWSIEDGVLKSPGLIDRWGASLSTKKHYRDFILMFEFRMPTISDSGINFRRLIPEIPGFGDMEQFNLRSKGGMGHLESYYFLPKEIATKVGLKEEEKPHVKHIDPEVGVWHRVKLTMQGLTFSAQYDGEVIHDKFQYHDWMLNMEPAPIRLQKHIVVHGENLGEENPCPIEYRNIFIKELKPGETEISAPKRSSNLIAESELPLLPNPIPTSPNAHILARIDGSKLPTGYRDADHQEYVDKRLKRLTEVQRGRLGKLWKEKQRIDPDMPNRGASFVKILEYVAGGAETKTAPPKPPSKIIPSSTLPDERFKNVSSVSPTPRDPGAPQRPNVIVLYVDDLGYQDIGCYGGPVNTPTLDGLAARGVRFTDFHSGSGVCSPSRAVLMTGRHHIRAGVYSVIAERDHKMHLLRREVTLAEVLQSNGYATAHFGKWHLGMPVAGRDHPTPADHGFDYWFGLVNGAHPSHKNPTNFLRNGKPAGKMEGYSCQIVVHEAITWLENKRDPKAPFFLNIWFNEPHSPIAAPDEIISKYGALDSPAAIYSGTIENTDRAIARLVGKLEADGDLDNTIIVYSSDNGSYRDERNGQLRGSKGSLYEGGHRVPGIISWPNKIPGGRVENEPAGVVDLLPTICGLTGIDKPQAVQLDGADISPLLTGKAEALSRHQPLFWIRADENPAMTLRDGPYALVAHSVGKISKNKAAMQDLMKKVETILKHENSPVLKDNDLWSKMFNSKFQNKEAERLRMQFVALNRFQESWIPSIKAHSYTRFELFDLEKDLSQKTDISEQHPEIVKRLKRQLVKISDSVMADGPDWTATEEMVAAKAKRPADGLR